MEARQDIGADRRVDVAQMGLGIGVIDGSCDVKLVHSMQTMFSEPHSGQVSFPVTVRGMRSSPQSLQPCTLGESCISFGFTSFRIALFFLAIL
jgi:hypothetical protein